MAMRGSSKSWLARNRRDPFVRRAHAQNYRSRAAFKLDEIDRRSALLKRGQAVVDLGAAPGGWSQIAAVRVGQEGTVIAVDLTEMKPIEDPRSAGVEFIQADINDPLVTERIKHILGRNADVVLSDLAPATTGHRATDQARIETITLAALALTRQILAHGGDFLVKTRHGGFDELIALVRQDFATVRLIKPAASRGFSAEIYILARGFQPHDR